MKLTITDCFFMCFLWAFLLFIWSFFIYELPKLHRIERRKSSSSDGRSTKLFLQTWIDRCVKRRRFRRSRGPKFRKFSRLAPTMVAPRELGTHPLGHDQYFFASYATANNIFYCVVPPAWPPWRQMQTINKWILSYFIPVLRKMSQRLANRVPKRISLF